MKIDPMLIAHDPSRYVVYQMVGRMKTVQNIEVVQKVFPNAFLFKTTPFVNTLYNYAHIFDEPVDDALISEIKSFFGKESFRIKTYANENVENFLLSHGFTFKDTGNIMVAKNIQDTSFEANLPKSVQIRKVVDRKGLDEYKHIFAEAFDCSIDDTNKKFGFLDSIIMDSNNDMMNVFVLYEDGKPVSTGAYYALDMFSIENIGTMKTARGKGYAFEIMKVLLNEAKRLAYTEACLVASDAGARVYQKVGFDLLQKTKTFIPV